MKTAANIVMLLFVMFLLTPTVVTVIEKATDTSYFFTMNEEEQTAMKELKEVKANFKLQVYHFDFTDVKESAPICSNLRLRHDNITPTIFSPPPNA